MAIRGAHTRRWVVAFLVLVLGLAVAGAWTGGIKAAPARASTTQVGMLEADDNLGADPMGTLTRLRMLGVQEVRLAVAWMNIAPSPNSAHAPRHFNATDPAAYPAANWTSWDTLVRDANQLGIGLNFDLMGGAPRWATGPGEPKSAQSRSWEPNPSMYQQFVQAVGTRYSGNYDPAAKRLDPGNPNDLPRVSFWSVWNEPDYGPSLAPQGVPGHLNIENSPRMYRNLVDAAWNGLHRSGHGSDTIIWGELAPRGMNQWGVFSGMKPLVFLRAMYCVDSHYRPLRGSAASARGCPTTASGSSRFRALNPALFQASGVSDHPYMRWYPPNHEAQPDPDYSSLAQRGNLENALDRLVRVYGSTQRFDIWDTEFGYLTTPPKHDSQVEPGGARYPWVTQTTAAEYLNWAEYISWTDSRMSSYMQYLLQDPLPSLRSNDWGGYASGLLNYNGSAKPTYAAWRLPLFLPVTSARQGQALTVWGCARPATYAASDTGSAQSIDIQFKPSGQGSFTTVQTVPLTNLPKSCYFDVRVQFPSSGTVRLSWSYPTADPQLNYFDSLDPAAVYSRQVQITLH